MGAPALESSVEHTALASRARCSAVISSVGSRPPTRSPRRAEHAPGSVSSPHIEPLPMPLRPLRKPGTRVACWLLALGLSTLAHPPAADAVMDIEDRGPLLNAGRYAFRPTNIGVLGNAFYDVGRSFDPSLEYPRGSGVELLKHADLWVGALDETGHGRVSGGPMLEWRPTLAADDRVRLAWRRRPGRPRGLNDDGDGRVDEERLNGRDDDGDGEVDEDIGIPADEMAASTYRDDQPEAVN